MLVQKRDTMIVSYAFKIEDFNGKEGILASKGKQKYAQQGIQAAHRILVSFLRTENRSMLSLVAHRIRARIFFLKASKG